MALHRLGPGPARRRRLPRRRPQLLRATTPWRRQRLPTAPRRFGGHKLPSCPVGQCMTTPALARTTRHDPARPEECTALEALASGGMGAPQPKTKLLLKTARTRPGTALPARPIRRRGTASALTAPARQSLTAAADGAPLLPGVTAASTVRRVRRRADFLCTRSTPLPPCARSAAGARRWRRRQGRGGGPAPTQGIHADLRQRIFMPFLDSSGAIF